MTFENPKEWSEMLVAQCGNSKVLDQAFQKRSLADIGELSIIFGAFYGLLASQHFTPGLVSGTTVDDAEWKKLLRLLIAIAFTWPFRLVNNFVRRAGIKNAYVNLWLG